MGLGVDIRRVVVLTVNGITIRGSGFSFPLFVHGFPGHGTCFEDRLALTFPLALAAVGGRFVVRVVVVRVEARFLVIIVTQLIVLVLGDARVAPGSMAHVMAHAPDPM